MRGVDVSRRFYDDEVAPVLVGVPHAAGRIGRGSDVLGYDVEVTVGPLFRDDAGEVSNLRRELEWYPPSVEQYVIASSWVRIDQELPFIGRARERGDLVGTRLITARVAKAVMHVSFLLERRWPPYPKWYGSAYGDRHLLDSEESICAALDDLAGSPVTERFHERPFRCVSPDFISSLPGELPLPLGIGSVEMWCDNVDVLSRPERRIALRSAYEAWTIS